MWLNIDNVFFKSTINSTKLYFNIIFLIFHVIYFKLRYKNHAIILL